MIQLFNLKNLGSRKFRLDRFCIAILMLDMVDTIGLRYKKFLMQAKIKFL